MFEGGEAGAKVAVMIVCRRCEAAACRIIRASDMIS